MKERNKIITFLMQHFNYSYETAITWLNAPNANFGLSSPNDLIKAGKFDKIMIFLISAKEGY